MKKASNKQTVSYEPVEISEETQVEFSKIVNVDGITISGNIKKKTEEATVNVGSVAYDNNKDTLAVFVSKKSALTDNELYKALEGTPGWIAEIMAEEA